MKQNYLKDYDPMNQNKANMWDVNVRLIRYAKADEKLRNWGYIDFLPYVAGPVSGADYIEWSKKQRGRILGYVESQDVAILVIDSVYRKDGSTESDIVEAPLVDF